MKKERELLEIIAKLKAENSLIKQKLDNTQGEKEQLKKEFATKKEQFIQEKAQLENEFAQEKAQIENEFAQEKAQIEKEFAQEKAKLLNKLHKLNEKLNALLLENKVYQDKYKAARLKAFIPKNERIDKIVINEAEEVQKIEKATPKEKSTNKGKKYKKDTFDYEKYVTETKIIESEQKYCETCNATLVTASEKVRYAVEVIPSTIKVIKIIKRTKKCPSCNKTDNKIYSPLVKSIDGSILTPSLASYIAYAKYELGVPFNHLEKHFERMIGFAIPKQNLSNYMLKTARLLEPIFERMKADLLSSGVCVIHSDETTLVVSKPHDESRKNSYVYSYTSSYYDSQQIRLYDFHESRSIDATTKWLKDYNGVIVCDNFSGYNKLAKQNADITLQKCWAHVRRRFADIVKGLSKEELSVSVSNNILLAISKIFEREKYYKEKKFAGKELAQARQKDMPVIKQEIYDLVYNANPAKKSLLETAINYTKNCWDNLFTFVDNPHVEPTNNTAERAIKPFVIQRKVFQTSGSNAGATATTILFSIVQTCNINNINIEKYLAYTLENIDNLPIEKLLPCSKNIKDKFWKKFPKR